MTNPDFTNTPLDHCQGFEEPCERTDAKWNKATTHFENDEHNWAYFCPEHKIASDKFWNEQWKEFWSDKL